MLLDLSSCHFSYPAKDMWHPKSDSSTKRGCLSQDPLAPEVALLELRPWSITWVFVPLSPHQLDVDLLPFPPQVTSLNPTNTENLRNCLMEFFSAPAPFSVCLHHRSSESLLLSIKGPGAVGLPPWASSSSHCVDQPQVSQSITPQPPKLRGEYCTLTSSCHSTPRAKLQELS